MRIETLTHHGLGRSESGALVPRTLPGEEVDEAGRILTPSSDRVAPPCRHFKSCGGCSVQHANDAFVSQWKHDIVTRALAAQGLDAPLRRAHVSPPETRRRAKFSGRRTKSGALVGFHARASDVIVPIPDCRVIRPALRALLPALEGLTAQIASRKGALALSVTDTPAGMDVLAEGARPGTGHEAAEAAWLADWAHRAGIARLSVNGETLLTLKAPVQPLAGSPLVPPPGAFLQATEEGQAALTHAVRDAVGEADIIADLFAGCGTFTLPLARRATIHAVEGSAPMLAALDTALRHAQGLRPITTEPRDLFRDPLTTDELSRFEALVIDPPRAGAEAQIRQISTTPRLAMVSCNPISFARDARLLTEQGYRLDWLDVIDQFRWSAHVELVGAFTLA